jgi:hypothetical protein
VQSIFFIVRGILKLLGTNVHNNEVMCHMQQPDYYLQVHLVIKAKHCLFKGICLVRSITFLSMKGFENSWHYVHNNKTMCQAQNTVAYLQGQKHNWRSEIRVFYRVFFVSSPLLLHRSREKKIMWHKCSQW